MGIANLRNNLVTDKPKQVVNVREKGYRVSKVVNQVRSREIYEEDTRITRLLANRDGADWAVTYYNQVVAEDDTIGNHDIGLATPFEQYFKIEKAILKVQTPLTDDPSAEGTATIQFGTIPMQGDVIYALLGNRYALIKVTAVEKTNYNLNDVYLITFKVDIFVDRDTRYLADLESKVVRTFTYNTDHVYTTGKVLLTPEDTNQGFKIKQAMGSLLKDIFYRIDKHNKVFKSKGYILGTVDAIGKPNSSFIDIYLQDFIFAVNSLLGNTTPYMYNKEYMDKDNINLYSIILQRDLHNFTKLKPYITTCNLDDNPYLYSLKYTNIDKIFIPSSTPDTSLSIRCSTDTFNMHATKVNLVNNPGTNYVFTSAFYKQDVRVMSILELEVYKYIKRENNDINNLMALYNNIELLQDYLYYYISPILLLMMYNYITFRG